jgi:hypothetical protein
MRAGRVAGCAPLAGATAQPPYEGAPDTATLAVARGAVSPLTGAQLRAQLRAQHPRNSPAQLHDGGTAAVAPLAPQSAHYRWRVILADHTAFEVCCLPELTLTEMRELYPGTTVQPLSSS